MEYKVIYSVRKTISIVVDDCKIVVKAPMKTDIATIEKLLTKHSAWIEKNIRVQEKKRELHRELAPEEIKHLKKSAREYLTEKTQHYAAIMGLNYGRITITSAKKRFGSCSSSGNISYSYRLMLYPEPAREYVVVHELAHLIEMNHSKRFYEIIAKILPDYKYRKKLLK